MRGRITKGRRALLPKRRWFRRHRRQLHLVHSPGSAQILASHVLWLIGVHPPCLPSQNAALTSFSFSALSAAAAPSGRANCTRAYLRVE